MPENGLQGLWGLFLERYAHALREIPMSNVKFQMNSPFQNPNEERGGETFPFEIGILDFIGHWKLEI